MSAPDQTTWHVTDDAVGETTLWHGDTAVWRESDFAVAGAEYRDQLWSVLTAVLAPDEATVERLADVFRDAWHDADDRGEAGIRVIRGLEAVFAALADTPAQVRHTADDATGDGMLEVERENWIRDRAQSARVADVRDGAAAADDGGDGAPEVDADGSRRAPYVRPNEDERQNRAPNVVAEYCCDFHNRNCEPPSELCCWECTEVEHPRHRTTDCIAPDLSAGFDVIAEPDRAKAANTDAMLRRLMEDET